MARRRRERKGLLPYLEQRLGACAGSGVEREFHCPFCIQRVGDESSKRKLYINVSKGAAYCFRCEYRAGTFKRFFLDLNGGHLRYEELEFVYGRDEATAPEVTSSLRAAIVQLLYAPQHKVTLEPTPLPEEYIPLAGRRGSKSLSHVFAYLDRRGVTDAQIERFRIGYAHGGRYRRYLLFPVVQGERVVYFTTRYAGDKDEFKSFDPKKQVNEETGEPTHYYKSHCLLNYDNVVGAEEVSLVEGAFDCVAADPAVATMGKNLSPHQIKLIESLVTFGLRKLTVMRDPDASAAATRDYDALVGRVPEVDVVYLTGGDPSDHRNDMDRVRKTGREPGPLDRVRAVLDR